MMARLMAGFEGTHLLHGQEGYEQARRGALWNACTPERYPQEIVIAACEQDVVRAVRRATGQGLRICVRSGGHSWAGNHLRDGSLLIDLSCLREISIDVPARRAVLQPGCEARAAMAALAEHGLFFPGGHCVGVAVGGYLLQGGFGWNGRVHGPACMSIEALDLVGADGELLHADAGDNADLLWAARGAGPGYFAVVTRFHLRVSERPPITANGVWLYGEDELEEVFGWAHAIAPQVPREMELMLILHRDERGELELVVTGPVITWSRAAADQALALLSTCPAAGRAKASVPNAEVTLEDLYAGAHAAYPDAHRYCADNMWTHASAEELMPGIRRIAQTMGPAPTHMLWMNWGPGSTPPPAREEMAFSAEDDTYIALYAVWEDPAQDAAQIAWATENMRALEPLASGVQLADENLGRRPARFVSDASLARLEEIRAARDPHGRFFHWMGRADR